MELTLKYGINPNQAHAKLTTAAADGPLRVVNGSPSYINVLDALRGWQLVRELREATGKAGAASYKHVSPAGAAVAGELSDVFRRAYDVPGHELSPVAQAYAKARSSDRVASFGDFIAVSERVDASLAQLIKPEVSDGIIAPGYESDAAEMLKQKKGGKYVMLEMDADYQPPEKEDRLEFGQRLEQSYNDVKITPELLTRNIVTRNAAPDAGALETLLVTTITLKHTQSNSVAAGYQGQAVGIGAGQQSRVACTRLACEKLERWLVAQHPAVLEMKFKEGLSRAERANLIDQFARWDELDAGERDVVRQGLKAEPNAIDRETRRDWVRSFEGVALSSDAFFPFRDNIDRAARSGVRYVAQAGGSKRDDDVIAAADEHGMVMSLTGLRLFLH